MKRMLAVGSALCVGVLASSGVAASAHDTTHRMATNQPAAGKLAHVLASGTDPNHDRFYVRAHQLADGRATGLMDYSPPGYMIKANVRCIAVTGTMATVVGRVSSSTRKRNKVGSALRFVMIENPKTPGATTDEFNADTSSVCTTTDVGASLLSTGFVNIWWS